jgi:hypothetical protein
MYSRRGPHQSGRFANDWYVIGSWRDPAMSTRPNDPIFVLRASAQVAGRAMGPTARALCVLVVTIFGLAVAHTHAQAAANQKGPRIPAGFSRLTDAFWEGPWVFVAGTDGTPIARLHNTQGQLTNGPIPIRLDDGSVGAMRVAKESFDDHWLDIVDSAGLPAVHLPLWAAYGAFDVVPVDLIGGPGDELIIVRIPGHASPRYGPELRIWRVASNKSFDLIEERFSVGDERFSVGEWLGTVEGAVSCAAWRTRLFINPSERKPRSIALHADFAADDWPAPGCHLSPQGGKEMAGLARGHVLHFKAGAYRRR